MFKHRRTDDTPLFARQRIIHQMLVARRRTMGFTQPQVAEAMGVSIGRVNQFEGDVLDPSSTGMLGGYAAAMGRGLNMQPLPAASVGYQFGVPPECVDSRLR